MNPESSQPRSPKTQAVELHPVPPDASLINGGESVDASVLDNETANALQTESTGQGVARATAGIGFLHVIRLLVGFAAQPLIANRLGLLASADVYTIATDIVTSIWRFFEKVVNPTFLPCFMASMREDGEEAAWRFASTAMWLTMLALFIVTPLSVIFMPWIVDLYSDKASAEQVQLTVAVSRLLMCGLFFLGVSSLTYVILNGYKRFFSAALGDTLWKIGVLIGVGAATALRLEPVQSLYFITWGFLIGSALKLLPHVLALRSKWHMLKPQIDWRDPRVKKMLWLGVPLLLGIVVSEGRDVYIKYLADSPKILVNGAAVEGSRTALKFSRTIGDSLIQIFPYALSIGIFPFLADLAHQRDRQPLTNTLLGALRICIFTFGPLTAILIALRFPLLRAVWESGQLNRDDTLVMSLPFVCYALGLIGFSCEMMLNQTFYAMTNVWAPTLVGFSTTVLWIIVATVGVHNGYGLASIAAAESIAKTTKCVILWILLRPKLGDVRVRDNLVFFAKVVVCSGLAAIGAWAISKGIAPAGEVLTRMDKIKMLATVALAGCGGLLVYAAAGKAFAIEEVGMMSGAAGKIRRKLARR
ncbi:MAG TPA: lipid II flippase MurJ [Abditibacteriaceae bacterium]